MQFTKDQVNKFLSWYWMEYKKDFTETLKACSARIINQGIEGDESKHMKKWKLIIKEIMGKEYSKKYKNTTRGERVFNDLRYNYGPKFIN